MTEIWTAKYESVFLYAVVNDEEILKSLLEQILEIKIDEIILVSEKLKKDYVYVKGKSVDILIKAGKDYINIELNTNHSRQTINRNISYACNILSNSVKKGDGYKVQPKVTQINLNFGNKGKIPIQKYQLYDNEHHKALSDILTICEVDVDFYKNLVYNNIENIKGKELIAVLDLDIENLKKLSKENRIVEKYTKNVIDINEERERFKWMSPEEEQKMWEITYQQIGLEKGMEQGLEKGLEKGLEQGIVREKENIAKKMLANNMNIDIIANITGLSIKKIEELQ